MTCASLELAGISHAFYRLNQGPLNELLGMNPINNGLAGIKVISRHVTKIV